MFDRIHLALENLEVNSMLRAKQFWNKVRPLNLELFQIMMIPPKFPSNDTFKAMKCWRANTFNVSVIKGFTFCLL
jgi:hypothetical protein